MVRFLLLSGVLIFTIGCSNPLADKGSGGKAPNAPKIDPHFLDYNPVAQNLTSVFNEDTVQTISLSYTNPKSENAVNCETKDLTNVVINSACTCLSGHCQVSVRGEPNYFGPAYFYFRVKDAYSWSNWAKVFITINAVNDPPVAIGDMMTTPEDTAVSITLVGSDLESSALTYTITVAPNHGTLSGTAPHLTYTPNSNYSGSDSVIFKVTDGAGDSHSATVLITITPVNDFPVAIGQSITTNEDVAQLGTLVGTDIDGDSLTYSVIGQGLKGTVVITDVVNGSFTYTPNINESGVDHFTFRVNDGSLTSNTATVLVTINPINDLPVASSQTMIINEDEVYTGTLVATDVESDGLTYSVVTQGSKGLVTITNSSTGAFTYTPNINENGIDSFTFQANDGQGNSNVATYFVTINPVNDAPIISASFTNANLKTDSTLAINFTIADVDSPVNCSQVTTDSSTIAVLPQNDLLLSGGATTSCTLTVAPSLNMSGSSVVTISLSDGINTVSQNFTLTLISLASISLSSVPNKIPVGYKIQINATGTYSDASTSSINNKATWSSGASVNITSNGGGEFQGTANGASTLSANLKGVTASILVTSVTWTNLTLSTNYISSAVDTYLNFKSIVNLTDGTFYDVTGQTTWSTGDNSLAEVSSLGKVWFKRIGDTTVTATFNGISVVGHLNINSNTISGLQIVGNNTINRYGVGRYRAILTYLDTSTQDVTTQVDWSVDDSTKGQIYNTDGNEGQFLAQQAGSVILTATMNNSVTANKIVTINNPTLSSISITPANLLAAKGQKIKYLAIGTYNDGTTADLTSQVTWASSILTTANFISGTSDVFVGYTGATLSQPNITATLGSIVGTTKLSVVTATISSIQISHTGNTVVGESAQLKAYGLTSDGGVMDLTHWSQWASGNPSIIAVSNSAQNRGLMTGLNNGSATVSANYSTSSASKLITVAPTSSIAETGDGLTVSYYTGTSGTSFASLVATRVEATINHSSASVNTGVGVSTNFSLRATGFIKAQTTQNYYICTDSDDGVRVSIAGVQVVNNWTSHGVTRNCSAAIAMTAGVKYAVMVEFFQGTGPWALILYWGSSTGSVSVIPQQYLYSQ